MAMILCGRRQIMMIGRECEALWVPELETKIYYAKYNNLVYIYRKHFETQDDGVFGVSYDSRDVMRIFDLKQSDTQQFSTPGADNKQYPGVLIPLEKTIMMICHTL